MTQVFTDTKPTPPFSTHTGFIQQTLECFRSDAQQDRIVPDAELTWLRENPRQVARIRHVEVLMDADLKLTVPAFVFSLRLLDPREADGWRLATVFLPGVGAYNFDADQTLEEVWASMEGDPAKENDFVLNALNEAVYTGELWAEQIIRSLVLPDTSALDPEDWGLDFTPYRTRT